MHEIKDLKDEIMHEFRASSNNLFTFAKAFPLVYEENEAIKPIDDVCRSKFELRSKIMRNFEESKKEVQIKFDTLTENLLKYVGKVGTRVLHLTSDCIDSDMLILEAENGKCHKMHTEELYKLFENYLIHDHRLKDERLPIDVVVLAIPDSMKIGKIFERLGVPHVLVFELEQTSEAEPDYDEATLMPFRFNWIYTFSIAFYTSLVNGLTVLDSFNSALSEVNDKK